MGPARPWLEVRSSYDRARRAQERGLGVDTEAHLPELVLTADPDALADLRTAVLAPLADLRPASAAKLAETLRAWLLHQGRRDDIAAALFVHPQTVRYRMAQLRELFGDKLEDPQTVLALTIALGVDPEPKRRTVQRRYGADMRRGPAAVLSRLRPRGHRRGRDHDRGGGRRHAASDGWLRRSTSPRPTIEWGTCAFYDPPAECATVQLPLDYDDPTGPTTRDRHAADARRRGEKIGTLFVNPGGPGGSVDRLRAVRRPADRAGRATTLRRRRHRPARGREPAGTPGAGCPTVAIGALLRLSRSPRRRRGSRLRADRAINEGCAERRSAIVDHASTADVARDMDVIRQALGEEQLSYYGISYGSLLGQTYAAMFPDRVRALIIDGVLDPIEWTRGDDPSLPMTYRLRSGRGAYEALTSALVECDRVGRARCPIAGHANETWLRVVRKARAGELRVGRSPDRPAGAGRPRARVACTRRSSIRYLIEFLAAVDAAAAPRRGRRRTRPSGRGQQLQRIRAARDAIGPYGVG